MPNIISSRTIAVALTGCMLFGLGAQGASAQSASRTIEPDHDLDLFHGRQSRSGDRQIPPPHVFLDDHFSRAFPGSHFTPRQHAMLERQGIRTIGDFIAADAAVIARVTGAPQRSVIGWQREISGKLR